VHGCTEANREFNTFVEINNVKYEISSEKKKEIDKQIEAAEKEYINQVVKEQTSYIWDIQRESIFPQFSKILYIAAILAMGVYLGNLYSLTTALILLGSTIVLIMIVNSISKSRRINEIKDLETFKTKFCRVKRPDISSYPKFLEE
jgi:magnesium-transporting ATPase (P-type)